MFGGLERGLGGWITAPSGSAEGDKVEEPEPGYAVRAWLAWDLLGSPGVLYKLCGAVLLRF